jgi:hypothetical protein
VRACSVRAASSRLCTCASSAARTAGVIACAALRVARRRWRRRAGEE